MIRVFFITNLIQSDKAFHAPWKASHVALSRKRFSLRQLILNMFPSNSFQFQKRKTFSKLHGKPPKVLPSRPTSLIEEVTQAEASQCSHLPRITSSVLEQNKFMGFSASGGFAVLSYQHLTFNVAISALLFLL